MKPPTLTITSTVPIKLVLIRFGKHWWIAGDPDAGPMGPYNTKVEAESDMRGIERFFRHGDEPGFVTSERKGK